MDLSGLGEGMEFTDQNGSLETNKLDHVPSARGEKRITDDYDIKEV